MSAPPFHGNDRFEVVRCLGSGGMGVVYEVFDKRRQTRVALKTLRYLDAHAVQRLKSEFRSLQDLEHPNLVRLLELFSDGDSWYFTMELLDGVGFLSWVRQEGVSNVDSEAPTAREKPGETRDTDRDLSTPVGARLTPQPPAPAPLSRVFHEARLRDALAQLAAGLAALHDAGKVHRDIKPSNLMVKPDGRLVLLDFGLVSDLNAERSSENVVGTIEYMAPEQAAARTVGAEADWYSVGVLLYEALTRRRPVEGHPLRVLQDKQWKVPQPPHELAPEVPEDLSALCMDLLRIDPKDRPGRRELFQRLSLPMPAAPSSGPSGVFVGRTRELFLLGQAFEQTRQGQAQFVLISGPSGLGKSALAKQFTRLVETPGLTVLRGRHYERESVPFRSADTIVDGLIRLIERLPAEERQALLPPDAGLLGQVFPGMRGLVDPPRTLPGDDRQELRIRMAATLRELLMRLARKNPVVGIIDDIQWSDSDSRRLLAEILRPPAPPMLLILTLRTPPGDSAMAQLWREGMRPSYGEVSHIDLTSLSSEESRELAGRLIGARLSGADVDTIAEESSGHPLFIDALVRHTLLRGPTHERLRLDDALQARIGELSAETRLVLDLVALAGAPLAVETLMSATQNDYAQVTRSVSALRIAGLLRSTRLRGGEALEAFHHRVRETVLAALPEAELRAAHDRLARALESSEADPAALFMHYRGAGNRERALHYAKLAAQAASDLLAFDRAVGLYRQALKLCEEGEEKRRLRVLLGHALANAGRGTDAAEAFLGAVEGAAAGEALELRRLGAEQLLRAGKFAEGTEAVRAVLAAIGMTLPNGEWQQILSFGWSRLRVRLRGLRFRERAPEDVPRSELHRIDVCWSMAGVLAIADTLGAAPFQARHLLFALSAGEPFRISRALSLEAGFLAAEGGRAERRALEVAEEADWLARRLNHPYALAWARGAFGVVATLNGRWRDGLAQCDESETQFRTHCGGFAWELATIQLFTLSSLFYLGRMEELARRVAKGLREAEARGDGYLAQCHRTAPGVMSWLAAGDLAGAREQLNASASLSSSRFHIEHCWRMISEGLVDLYAGDGARAFARIEERWPMVQSTMARVQLLRVEALLTQGRAALAAGGEKHAQLARRIGKKLAGEGVAWVLPLGQLLSAGAAMAEGQREPALSLLSAAQKGFEACEMQLYAACAGLRLGQLRGGQEGSALVSAADSILAREAVREPTRLVAMLAPGFPD